MKKPGPTSSHPPKAKAKQAAEERAQGKTQGAGQEFSRLFEPEIDAAQNHEDHITSHFQRFPHTSISHFEQP